MGAVNKDMKNLKPSKNYNPLPSLPPKNKILSIVAKNC